MKLPISLCMIVRDEEDMLSGCLASAEPYVSEIIVVDTGSRDETIPIAESYGAVVVRAEWEDDFSGARNRGLELAEQPWILVLDADERLLPCSEQVWERLLSPQQTTLGYYVTLSSLTGDVSQPAEIRDMVCRLFRNDPQIRFAGTIHEEAATSITAIAADGIGIAYCPIVIRHYGYLDEMVTRRDKITRNLRLIERALHLAPEDPVLRYAMGAESFAAGRMEQAVEWLAPLAAELEAELATELATECNGGLAAGCLVDGSADCSAESSADDGSAGSGYGSDLFLKLSHAYRQAGRLAEAVEWAKRGVRMYPDFPDLYEAAAAAHLTNGQPVEALFAYEEAIDVGTSPPYYTSAPGAGTYRAMYGAGLASEQVEQWVQAAAYYGRAIQLHSAYYPAWERLLQMASCNEPVWAAVEEALAHYSALLQGSGGVPDLKLLELLTDLPAEKATVLLLQLLPLTSAAEDTACSPRDMLAGGAALAAAGRWAAASDRFASAARASASDPLLARAAAFGLAASFAARSRAHAVAARNPAGERSASLPLLELEAELLVRLLIAIYQG